MNRLFLLAVAGCAVSIASHASDSCAVQATRLVSQEKWTELSAMFTAPDEGLVRSLAQLASKLGPIDEVRPLPHQTVGVSIQQSVVSATLPASYKFEGSWALALTRRGERYEIQAASEPGSPCRLLALHLSMLAGVSE